jgi:hypothetical protein
MEDEWPDIYFAASQTTKGEPVIQIRADWKMGARARWNINLADPSASTVSGGYNLKVVDKFPKVDLAFRLTSKLELKLGLVVSFDAKSIPSLKKPSLLSLYWLGI